MRTFFASKVFLWAVVFFVGAAILYAVFLMGSPGTQRAMRMDLQRVSHLQQISYALEQYWVTRGELPETLGKLRGEGYYIDAVVDPQTGEPYEYRVLGEEQYELCAVFELDSEYLQDERIVSEPFSDFSWEHGSGPTCFQKEIVKADFDSSLRTIPLYK
ncbi:hypothetical protein KKI17_02305 [Patescibacteria group bacterium]|nr:hypothetical protein [Patescibacteria group bacterium]